MPERGSFPPLKLRVNNWALSGQALIMTPNKQSAPNEFIGTCDLNDLAEHYKVEVRIVPAEDLDDKTARIKREAEDAKMKRWLTLLLVLATIALCAWSVSMGQGVGEFLKSAVPAVLGYLFGKYKQSGDK